jgi:hypothetical protein
MSHHRRLIRMRKPAAKGSAAITDPRRDAGQQQQRRGHIQPFGAAAHHLGPEDQGGHVKRQHQQRHQQPARRKPTVSAAPKAPMTLSAGVPSSSDTTSQP